MIAAASWSDQLHDLAFRLSVNSIGPELAGLTLANAWELFVFLQRVTGGADAG